MDTSSEPRSEASLPPTTVSSILSTRQWPIRQKRIGTSHLVLDTWHSSQCTVGRKDSPLGCSHQAMTYRYYFSMNKMFSCFRALAAREISIISELLHVRDASNEPRSEATLTPTTVSSTLTTRQWLIRQNRIGTIHLVLDIWHGNESTMYRKDSPLGCFQLTLDVYFCIKDTWEQKLITHMHSHSNWYLLFWQIANKVGLMDFEQTVLFMTQQLAHRVHHVKMK